MLRYSSVLVKDTVLPALCSGRLGGAALAGVESPPSVNPLASKSHMWKITSAGEKAKLPREGAVCSKVDLHTTLSPAVSSIHTLTRIPLEMPYNLLQDSFSLPAHDCQWGPQGELRTQAEDWTSGSMLEKRSLLFSISWFFRMLPYLFCFPPFFMPLFSAPLHRVETFLGTGNPRLTCCAITNRESRQTLEKNGKVPPADAELAEAHLHLGHTDAPLTPLVGGADCLATLPSTLCTPSPGYHPFSPLPIRPAYETHFYLALT